ncbi:MAG: ParB/RepB/Spo0J family partition protein [Armatimonadetes bacterium]|nr:ParB/RepB/Spo0J family partition protein [Armatimonadota bacterium]
MERRRGIRSLIPTGTLAESEALIQEVPLERISPSPFQPRRDWNEEALAELVNSMRMHGILQPLAVRRTDSGYQLIAGERRLRAAKQIGMERVPVVVRTATDREMLELALVENLQREDINPMEEAEAYQRLMEEFSLTQEQVAERVGRSRPTVANSLRLLNLPEEMRASLRQGEINEGHGKALVGIRDEKLRRRLWRRVVRKGLSVRETEAAANKLLGRDVPRGTSTPEHQLDPNLQDLLHRLRDHLGSRIALKPKARGRGGSIHIQYTDDEDLDRISAAILG